MTDYRFLAYNLVTNTAIAELPLSDVAYSQRLNEGGALTAKLTTDDPAVTFDPIAATQPNVVGIYVERAGTLIDGYIIATRRRTLSTATIEIGGNGFADYYKQRLAPSIAAQTNVDPLPLVRNLFTTIEATGQGLGLTIGSETSSSHVSLAAINWAECRTVMDVVNMIAKAGTPPASTVSVGFDWSIDVAWNGSSPARYLHLWYPSRGRVVGNSQIMFDSDSNLFDFIDAEDGTRQGNNVVCVGQGQGTQGASVPGMLASTASNVSGGGYMQFDRGVTGLKDITNKTLLDARAANELRATVNPVEIATAVVNGSMDPPIGSYYVGDNVRVRTSTRRLFPSGIDAYYRIVQIAVKVDNVGRKQVTLTLNPV
jgi:hypothetical protein